MSDGTIRIDTVLNTKKFEAQILQLEKKLKNLQDSRALVESGGDPDMSDEEYTNLLADIEKLQNRIASLKERQAKETEKQKDAEEEMEGAIGKQSNGLSKILKKVKQYGMAILGARGAYMAIRKIINSVTADNEKLANTITGLWAGLGAVFEPFITSVIEGLANILSYAMTVVKVLTGIDVFAKAQKAINKQNKGNNLASFDKSEVLNKGKSNASYLKQVELGEKALEILRKFKEWWDSLNFVEKLALVISAVTIIAGLIKTIKASGILTTIATKLTPILTTLGGIVAVITGIVIAVKSFIKLWTEGFDGATYAVYLLGIAIATIGAIILGAPATIAVVVGAIVGILGGLVAIIHDQWDSSLSFGENVLNGLITAFEMFVNFLIKGLNWLIDKINSISFTVPDWVPVIGGKSMGFNIGHVGEIKLGRVTSANAKRYQKTTNVPRSIPALAQGAVIQPNKPFMAMLGDQRFGRNIEAPEDLIRQIVAEESGNRTVNVTATGDVGQLLRFFKFELDKEQRRTGMALVS